MFRYHGYNVRGFSLFVNRRLGRLDRLGDGLGGRLRDRFLRRPYLGDVQECREALLIETAGVVGRQVARRPRIHVVRVAATLADYAAFLVPAALQDGRSIFI